MLSLPKTIVTLTLSSILSLVLASPAAGQGLRRGVHARANYVVGSFAPVAPVYRPGNFTRMFADYHVYPFRLPYFSGYATPGFFQSYYRPAPVFFDPIFSARVITLDSVAAPSKAPSKLAISDFETLRPTSIELKRPDELTKRPDSRKLGAGAATASGNLISTKHDAADYQRLAEKEFRKGDFFEALRHVNHGLIEDRDNGKLYLFAAHASLASGEYRAAVDQLEIATTLLHQNDWDFVIRNRFEAFYDVTYQDGIDSLLEYSARNPNSFDALLLKGFHLGCRGNLEQSQIELATALSLEPENALVNRLLNALKLPTAASEVSSIQPVEQLVEQPVEDPFKTAPGLYLGQPSPSNEVEILPVPAIIEDEEEIHAEPVEPEDPAKDWLDLEPTLELVPQPESVLQLDGN